MSETGKPDMGRYVSSVVSTRTGSDVSIDDIVWVSGTGDLVGCVSTGWTEACLCDMFGVADKYMIVSCYVPPTIRELCFTVILCPHVSTSFMRFFHSLSNLALKAIRVDVIRTI